MKKLYLLHLKEDLAAAFAKYSFEKGVTVQISYLKDFMWDGEKLIIYAIVPEENAAAFETEYKNYIKG